MYLSDVYLSGRAHEQTLCLKFDLFGHHMVNDIIIEAAIRAVTRSASIWNGKTLIQKRSEEQCAIVIIVQFPDSIVRDAARIIWSSIHFEASSLGVGGELTVMPQLHRDDAWLLHCPEFVVSVDVPYTVNTRIVLEAAGRFGSVFSITRLSHTALVRFDTVQGAWSLISRGQLCMSRLNLTARARPPTAYECDMFISCRKNADTKGVESNT